MTSDRYQHYRVVPARKAPAEAEDLAPSDRDVMHWPALLAACAFGALCWVSIFGLLSLALRACGRGP